MDVVTIIDIDSLKLFCIDYNGLCIRATYRILVNQGCLQCKLAMSDPLEELHDLADLNWFINFTKRTCMHACTCSLLCLPLADASFVCI